MILLIWRVKVGAFVLALSALLLVALGVLPIGALSLRILEAQFAPTLEDVAPDGIVLLGGSVVGQTRFGPQQVPINQTGERIAATVALAGRYPEAAVIVTDLNAQPMVDILVDMGLAPERIVMEDKAQSTYDNAVFSRALVEPQADERFILVTSAWHMPRSVGTFRAAGWPEPIAYPVDYETDVRRWWRVRNYSVADGLRLADLAAREWLATLMYWHDGRIESLLTRPGPALNPRLDPKPSQS
ncbi:MAG: YdcF family protein [Pseudomonadota bacterium]